MTHQQGARPGRNTADLIVAWLAIVIGVVVIVSVIGAIAWRIADPEDADLTDLVARVGDLVNTLVGAVVGYLAGRGVVTKTNGNGAPPRA